MDGLSVGTHFYASKTRSDKEAQLRSSKGANTDIDSKATHIGHITLFLCLHQSAICSVYATKTLASGASDAILDQCLQAAF